MHLQMSVCAYANTSERAIALMSVHANARTSKRGNAKIRIKLIVRHTGAKFELIQMKAKTRAEIGEY